jgi:thiol-disulfide isomerase/thioredoxin
LLAKEVVQKYGSAAEFVSENWGDSKLAERFGLKRYPVVFVNDILIARPDDFGWFGDKGKYTPWSEPAGHERFKKDLERMIDIVLRGDTQAAQEARNQAAAASDNEIARRPEMTLDDLRGNHLTSASLSGKIVIAEIWATWCPFCRTTLDWLGEVKRQYGDKVEILAITVESEAPATRKLTDALGPAVHVVMADAAIATAFGDVTSVPTMFIFDGSGKTSATIYGAPPDLHDKVSRALNELLGTSAAGNAGGGR